MLMTAADLKNLINQVNEAFKGQFNRLSDLEAKVTELEEQISKQNKGSTASKNRKVNNTK